MRNLSRILSCNKNNLSLLIKRDDCTGLAFGGNKVRQLEFYLGEAAAQGEDTILITGAVQSNFVGLATAAARTASMECHIQLENRVQNTSELYSQSAMSCKINYWGQPFTFGQKARTTRGRPQLRRNRTAFTNQWQNQASPLMKLL
ncbi:MAG: hypothetical protein CMQ11_00375 [Gammaproteobacteria bacterium]|nr:hypothetical protein [Gammaproteobacteria bacterium]